VSNLTRTLRDVVTIAGQMMETTLGPVFASPINVPACVDFGFRRITNRQGQEVVASAFLILGPDATLNVDDQVNFEGIKYETVDVQPMRVNGKIDHIEAYLKSVGSD